MTITQYNSNNSLTPEFKWALFEKRNNLDELINVPTKAEERSMIQISFRTQDPNIKTGTIQNPRQNSQLIHDPQCFQNPQICSIYGKNPQSVHFLRPNPSIRKPIHPPPLLPKFQSFREDFLLSVFVTGDSTRTDLRIWRFQHTVLDCCCLCKSWLANATIPRRMNTVIQDFESWEHKDYKRDLNNSHILTFWQICAKPSPMQSFLLDWLSRNIACL